MGGLATLARVLHVLLLSVWLGGCAFYTAMAPEASRILDSRQLLADLLGSALGVVESYGALAGPAIVLTLVVGWLPLRTPLKGRVGAAFLMTALVIVSSRFVTPKLEAARLALGRPLEDLDPSDVLLLEYERLHSLSTVFFSAHALLAFLLLVWAVSAVQPKQYGGIQL